MLHAARPARQQLEVVIQPGAGAEPAVQPLMDGDHMTRRPADSVEHHGFRITERERFSWGIVERLVAVKTP